MTSVSVLVAAYNAASTLPRCLDSLCRQTLADIQILCVDDCSTDETFDILENRAKMDARIEVLQTPVNSGQAVARNLALTKMKAPLVCMVDADDWLSPDALEKAVEVFHLHPKTDCCLFRLVECYEQDGRQEDYPLPAPLELGEALTGAEAFELCLDGWQLHGLYVTRAELHRQIPFDTATRLYSDDNTSRLHYLHSREVRACTGTYYYMKHPASMTIAFSLRRFDYMEANLSLLLSLKKENISRPVMRRFEGSRWMTFIACYRLYLNHIQDIPENELAPLKERFQTVLHTFRPSRLPWSFRWRPGYWLTLSLRRFDAQQRLYLFVKRQQEKLYQKDTSS
ncbi:MAG: glycosyltransferase family 2 protein [Bacteroidaceae bacterium]|nr:glycosyltransferase family 2 protein [Bacteroidaceae bacterium]